MTEGGQSRRARVIRLRLGDSLEVLRDFPSESLGAVITDPPYGLEFMGADWDAPWKYGFSSHGFSDGGQRQAAPNFNSSRNPICGACGLRQRTWKGGPPSCACDVPEWDQSEQTAQDRKKFQDWAVVWLKECHRILRPVGVIKVFGATRVFHRMASAMEQAGFELVPEHSLEAWLTGEGFPKYLNTGKAIDQLLGQADKRPVVGHHAGDPSMVASKGWDDGPWSRGEAGAITTAASEEAKQFEGFATALKPGWEPFLVGRKA